MTEKQERLVKMYAKKHQVEENWLLDCVRSWKTTLSEISQGILGRPVNPRSDCQPLYSNRWQNAYN